MSSLLFWILVIWVFYLSFLVYLDKGLSIFLSFSTNQLFLFVDFFCCLYSLYFIFSYSNCFYFLTSVCFGFSLIYPLPDPRFLRWKVEFYLRSFLFFIWDLPRPGLEPVSPALAGGFLTTAPPGKPLVF